MLKVILYRIRLIRHHRNEYQSFTCLFERENYAKHVLDKSVEKMNLTRSVRDHSNALDNRKKSLRIQSNEKTISRWISEGYLRLVKALLTNNQTYEKNFHLKENVILHDFYQSQKMRL